jgi:CheY-like chemotaxis protein
MQGKRVLVVDDDHRILDGTTRMLEEEGCEAHSTADPQTVLDEARRIRPDVILLDVMMPKMNGYEVFEKLQAEPSTSEIPVVLMTAKAITLRMPASYLHELAGLVNKPFSKYQLINGLRAALEKKKREQGH